MTPEQQRQIEKRQRTRSIITALILGAMVLLFFFIALSKMAGGTMH